MAFAHQTQWIRAGWLIDGSGAPATRNTFIAIQGGVIAQISPTLPPATPCEDLSHATILPALMDAHVHLAYSGSMDSRIRAAQLKQTPEEAAEAVRRHLADQWRHGVIAVRDGGDRLGAALQYKRSTGRSSNTSVTVKTCGQAWHTEGRYGSMLGKALPEETAEGTLAAQMEVIDHLKVIQSGLNSIDRFGHTGPPQFSSDALCAMVSLAHRAGRPVMVHANGEAPVRLAIEAGCDSIEHGYFMGEDNLRRMADRRVCWVPTVVPMTVLTEADNLTIAQKDVARRTVDHQLSQIRKALELGVVIALGTDAGGQGVDHGAAVQEELSLLISVGMSVEQAVQCATRNVARLLSLDGRGELRPGCRTDFLAVKAEPDDLIGSLAGEHSLWVDGQRQS